MFIMHMMAMPVAARAYGGSSKAALENMLASKYAGNAVVIASVAILSQSGDPGSKRVIL